MLPALRLLAARYPPGRWARRRAGRCWAGPGSGRAGSRWAACQPPRPSSRPAQRRRVGGRPAAAAATRGRRSGSPRARWRRSGRRAKGGPSFARDDQWMDQVPAFQRTPCRPPAPAAAAPPPARARATRRPEPESSARAPGDLGLTAAHRAWRTASPPHTRPPLRCGHAGAARVARAEEKRCEQDSKNALVNPRSACLTLTV